MLPYPIKLWVELRDKRLILSTNSCQDRSGEEDGLEVVPVNLKKGVKYKWSYRMGDL